MTILWWTNVAGDSTVEYGTTPALGSSVTVAQAGSCEIGAAGTCHAVAAHRASRPARATTISCSPTASGRRQPARSTSQTLQDAVRSRATSSSRWSATGAQARAPTTNVANLQNAADPPMIVTVGDNAYTNGTQSDWDNNALAYYVNPMLRAPLFMPTLGNHDVNDVGAGNWFNSVEIKMFPLPRNAPPGRRSATSPSTSGDVHFIVLDSNRPRGDPTQTQRGSQNDLATTTRKWKFVFLHHTPYSCANGRRLDRQQHDGAHQLGPALRVLRRRHRLRRSRPHLRAHPSRWTTSPIRTARPAPTAAARSTS